MFKFLFALFALFAVAFAAPVANPSPVAPVITYGTLGYSSLPHVTTYNTYSHVGVPTAYAAAVPSAYVYGAAPVVYG